MGLVLEQPTRWGTDTGAKDGLHGNYRAKSAWSNSKFRRWKDTIFQYAAIQETLLPNRQIICKSCQVFAYR
ncbi:hypothetical protein [Methylobacterium sp. E-045]|uniref:hypothetical protein n=1 Tax=Methylobacterium sp. E-045 TaxID=2836575 RepID=UPI001FB9A360|nr:hypothetical protein [Methylobacterium sp. E-045]MCJ2129815.1 hypothetical protein [Methylobacterium sp. E-045]